MHKRFRPLYRLTHTIDFDNWCHFQNVLAFYLLFFSLFSNRIGIRLMLLKPGISVNFDCKIAFSWFLFWFLIAFNFFPWHSIAFSCSSFLLSAVFSLFKSLSFLYSSFKPLLKVLPSGEHSSFARSTSLVY